MLTPQKAMEETPAGPRRFRDLSRQSLLGLTVPVATTRIARLMGLTMLDREDAGEGLLIPDCRSVHTFGMRFELDLLFLGEQENVVELRRSVPPGRRIRCPVASSVLELPSPRQPGENFASNALIWPCCPRSKSWRRWWSVRTTIRLASSSATT